MAMLKEALNRGLVTARDATLLGEGELQQADDMILRPFDPAVHRAPGRTAYGTVLAAATVSCETVNTSTTVSTRTANFNTAFVGQTITGANIPASTTISAILARTQTGPITCTVSGTTTITAPAGTTFTNLKVGQILRGTGFPVGTTIASFTSSTVLVASAAGTNGSNAITFDPTIQITNAATSSNTAISLDFGAATVVKGLRHVAFDDNEDLLIGYVGESLLYSTYTAATGSFSFLTGDLPNAGTETLDAVHYKNAHFLFTGGTPKRVGYTNTTDGSAPVPTGRAMGMQAIPGEAAWTVATTSGSWSTLLGVGVYWFVLTEVINPNLPDEVESTYNSYDKQGKPLMKTVTITDVATQAVLVTVHAPYINDGSNGRNTLTHWRVYMSERQPDTSVAPPLTNFTMVAEVEKSTTSITITATNNTTSGYAGASTAVTGWTDGVGTTGANNMLGAPNNIHSTTRADNASATLRTFGLNSAISGTITGVEVTVYGRWIDDGNSSAAGVWVALSKDNGATEATARREIRFVAGQGNAGASFGYEAFKSGGQFDKWGTTWAVPATELANGNFAVKIGKIGTYRDDTMAVDSVLVKFYAGGAITDLTVTKYFPTIVISSEVGVTSVAGANYPPPNATTGDIFDAQLVMNDTSRKSVIRYSIPDKPEYFPLPYFLDFNSKPQEEVTCVRRVGNILVVGMSNSLKRVNYLPREDDADFSRGRAWEDITTAHGIAGPQAAAVFDMGTGPVLAYVAHNGIHVTDGVRSRPLNIDLAWASTVERSRLQYAVLVNYAALYSLVLYYTPTGGSANTKALWFNYHPVHMKEGGQLPAMGPVSVSGRSATYSEQAGVIKLLTGHATDGKVYLEDNGTSSEDATNGIAPALRTRLQYLADVGSKARPQRVYVRVAATGTTLNVASTTVTEGSTAATSAAGFGSVTVGMGVTGSGIQPGTRVAAKADSSNITLSAAATTAGTVTLTFSTGACLLTMRKQNIDEAVADMETLPFDTVTGGLVRVHLDNQAEAHELKISKLSTVDADLRIHYLGYDAVPHGREHGTL